MNFNLLIFWLPKAKTKRLSANKKRIILSFLLLARITIEHQYAKLIQGRVVSPKKDVTGVTIQNITSQIATITDLEGNFSIRVEVGDTLIFSAIQFKRKQVPISQNLMDSPFIQIPMEEFVNELKEVTVQPFDL